MLDIFSKPRFRQLDRERIRQRVSGIFSTFGMETVRQDFVAEGIYNGVNIIAIKPGKLRKAGKRDKIMVVASHYDSVEEAPGIDDNGSGSTVVIEVARLLHQSKVELEHTIYFVCNDLEEYGLLGSIAFVKEYLVPNDLIGDKADFLGAYVMDMALVYDPRPGVQTLPEDVAKSCAESVKLIAADGWRGDFAGTWMRAEVDDALMGKLEEEWAKTQGKKYKLRKLRAPLDDIPPNFHRSDHASFWMKHEGVNKPLPAMLVSDLGPWRGKMAECYHQPCDNQQWLTEDNLNFIKKIIDSMFRVVAYNPPDPFENFRGFSIPNLVIPGNVTEWY